MRSDSGGVDPDDHRNVDDVVDDTQVEVLLDDAVVGVVVGVVVDAVADDDTVAEGVNRTIYNDRCWSRGLIRSRMS